MTFENRIKTTQRAGRMILRAGSLLLVASLFQISSVNADNMQQQATYMTPQEQQTAAAQRARLQVVNSTTLTQPTQVPGMPPAPGGAVFQTGIQMKLGGGQKRTQLNYLCKDQTPRELYEYYERTLRNDGWKVVQWMGKGEVPRMVMGSKGRDTTLSVQFNTTKKAKGCRICLVLNEK